LGFWGADRYQRAIRSAVAQLVLLDRSDEELAVAACKLLPMGRKLLLLTELHCNNAGNDVTAASHFYVSCIYLALADEQWAWRQHKWSGDWPREKLINAVKVVNTVAAFDMTTLLANDGGKAALVALLARYCTLLDVLPSIADRLWFFRRTPRSLVGVQCHC